MECMLLCQSWSLLAFSITILLLCCDWMSQQQDGLPHLSKSLVLLREQVCFVAFWDEVTLKVMADTEGITPDQLTQKVGIWRVVLVKNLPFVDQRRNGKIPKVCQHSSLCHFNVALQLLLQQALELDLQKNEPFTKLDADSASSAASQCPLFHLGRFQIPVSERSFGCA